MISKNDFEALLKKPDFTSILRNSSKESIEKSFGTDVANIRSFRQFATG